MEFTPKDQQLLVYMQGEFAGKKFCGGMVLKYIKDDNYKITQIAPIFDNHFYRNVLITIENIEAKCKNNNWTVQFTPIRKPA